VALMFGNCTALTSLDLSSFNTAKVTDMYGMFSYCSSLTTIYGNNWDTEKVTDGGSVMFDNCTNLVGGAGSAYEFYHGNDKTYARIDGGPDAPGYFTDKTTAAIKGISMGMAAGEAITYNLNGQRVAQPTKGLFIVNGKKVVIK
jgi:surface protein